MKSDGLLPYGKILVGLLVVAPWVCLQACGRSGPVMRTRSSHEAYELILSADNGHAQSPLSLRVRSNGNAELDVGGPAALPGVSVTAVGHFGTRLQSSETAELHNLIEAADIPDMEEPPGPLPSGDYATLTLIQGASRYSRTLWQEADRDLDALLNRLRRIATALLNKPVRAIRGSVAKATGTNTLTLKLHHVGTEPFPIELLSPTTPQNYVRVRLWFRRASAQVPAPWTVTHEAITALVESGKLAKGTITLQPGQTLELPFASIDAPSGTIVEGSVGLWKVGPGLARQTLNLTIGPTTIP